MYRTLGQYEQALAQAQRIAEAEPDDLMAALDVAELSLEVGQLDEAVAAFQRLRELDDVPGHEAYPLHGMIKAEIQREGWQRALALAREAPAQRLAGTHGQPDRLPPGAGWGTGRAGAHARGGRRRAERIAVRVPPHARRRPPSRLG